MDSRRRALGSAWRTSAGGMAQRGAAVLAVGGSQPLTSAASHSLPSRLLQDAFQAPAAALLSSRALSAQPCAAISQDDHARTSMAPKGESCSWGRLQAPLRRRWPSSSAAAVPVAGWRCLPCG